MNKKLIVGGDAGAPPEWDPNAKEQWFFEFEEEPVNDEKWSCIVTAAIQNETQDEQCIQTYTECVNTGLRKAVKIISLTDVVKLLKGSSRSTLNQSKKDDKSLKSEGLTRRSPQRGLGRRYSQVVDLAAKYATFAATECKLHPELMAAVLKYMILNLKDENCHRKRVDAVKQRKKRDLLLKEKFIRGLKPYEATNEETEDSRRIPPNLMELEEPIDDEPIAGPDLYIMLTDFYNALYFPELQTIRVPFVAILKITSQPGSEKSFRNSEVVLETTGSRRRATVAAFWEKLNEEYFLLATTSKFKQIAMLEYQAPVQTDSPKQYYRTVFDELTWTQYSAYSIYRQYQKYLEELHVQKITVSLETLDLSTCEMYNKMCDALVSGESLTPLLVLYSMVEQVVAGVPPTENMTVEYEYRINDSHQTSSSTTQTQVALPQVPLVTPCKQCRVKKYESPCSKLKQQSDNQSQIFTGEWANASEENSLFSQSDQSSSKQTEVSYSTSSTPKTLETLITKVLTDKKTEKELREDKRWKTPGLCFYGDFVFLESYHCDPRLFDSGSVVERFFKNSALPNIWRKYPELSDVERAFCNFHLNTLQKLSQESEEAFKLQILFTLSMSIVGRTYRLGHRRTGISETDQRTSSDIKLNRNLLSLLKMNENNFRNYFIGTFIAGLYFQKMGIQKKDVDLKSEATSDSQAQIQSGISVNSLRPDSGGDRGKDLENTYSSRDETILTNFYSVLNCHHISHLAETRTSHTADFEELIQDFKFYEQLEPNLMIQRLVGAHESFNSVQYSYFAPMDTLIVVLTNDFDSRGIYRKTRRGVIPTPVGLRDFYHHVYPEITNWLIDEEEEYTAFTLGLTDKTRAKEEKKDAEFLSQLKRKYCLLSEEKKAEFLETTARLTLSEAREKELGELPVKPKPKYSNTTTFVVTNITDVQMQNEGSTYEFYSKDGTQVRADIDSWLYDPLQLLRVQIKRASFTLYYNQWLGHRPTTDFTFKTNSDIIFSFRTDEDSTRTVTISWPTGLLIRPVPLGSGIYIKQNYLKPYRTGWEIEDEKSRCFLRNGEVLIFKKNGDYDILFGSGTKYAFYDSNVPRYDIISATGEVWQVRTKGPCKNRKTLMSMNKIFMGVDPNTKETFYKREDGTYCMLWPSGKLVTNYPDGTKITTTPYFEEEEVTTDWTEDEKLFYVELDSKLKLEQVARSKTILRNSVTPKTGESKLFIITGFVVVSCAYVMEHPKYSSVYFDPDKPYVTLRMPEELTVFLYPEGNHRVQKGTNFLNIDEDIVEFFMLCPECKEKSTVYLYLDSSETVCKCVDYFQETFFVYRNGETKFLEYDPELGPEDLSESEKPPDKSGSNIEKCKGAHFKNEALMNRCFAFDRDLSGVEFLHVNSLSCHFYRLPEESYFELNTDDPSNICHTSNSPYYKIGHERWVMEYEENTNSLPTNLKKKDMKEVGVKQVPGNTFKFPFPKHHNCGSRQETEKPRRKVHEPKVIVSRTVRCLSQNPNLIMEDLQKYVAEYHEKAVRIFNEYRKHKVADDRACDARYVEMRLRKIALTLSQSLQMYPHLCTNLPSTEKDIHYFGHFINTMEGMRPFIGDPSGLLPVCKQIPPRLPRSSDFSSISEESDSPRHT